MKASLVAVLAVTCMFAIALGIQAQDAPKTMSHVGCLKAGDAPGTYQLTDLEKGPKSVGIVSSDVNLAPHVGHKIEITGTLVTPDDAMKGKARMCRRPLHYMHITAMKMMSLHLPIVLRAVTELTLNGERWRQ